MVKGYNRENNFSIVDDDMKGKIKPLHSSESITIGKWKGKEGGGGG